MALLIPSLARLCLARGRVPTGMQSAQTSTPWEVGDVLYYQKKQLVVSRLLSAPPVRRVRIVRRRFTSRYGEQVVDYTVQLLDDNGQDTNEATIVVNDDVLSKDDPEDSTDGEDESYLPPQRASTHPARSYPGWVPKKAPVEDERDPPKKQRTDESALGVPSRAPPTYRHTEQDYVKFRRQLREDETLKGAKSRLSPIIGEISKMRATDLLSSGRQDQKTLYNRLFMELMDYLKGAINEMINLILNNPLYVNAWRQYIKEELRPAFAAGQIIFPYGYRVVDEGEKVDGELVRGELYDGVFQVESATLDKEKHRNNIVKILKSMYREKRGLE
jgi:hypothetical protein